MAEKLNWKALKDGNCPKCDLSLGFIVQNKQYVCYDNDCGFKIGSLKFADIIAGKKRAPIVDEVEDNLSDLNNL